jgi:DNA-binding GntR family transcriptional regulator
VADQRGATPPYLQIAADLRGRIESGELAPGDMVPSITRLTQEYGVSKGTAVKALDVLRREGLTRTVAGWGTFVAERD